MYTDLLPRIKNAAQVRKEGIRAPYSRMDFDIAKVLEREGFLANVRKKKIAGKAYLEAAIAYQNGDPIFEDFSLKSKPSRHLYRKAKELRPVKQGFGKSFVSTSRGVMTGEEARKQNVGGEYLFEIW